MPGEKELQNTPRVDKVAEKPNAAIKQESASLVKYGGFKVVETTIEEAHHFNPEKSSLKATEFLTLEENKSERERLKKRLQLVLDLLASSEDRAVLIENVASKSDALTKLQNKNILRALDATRELEQSYRSVNYFFKNTGSSKVSNVLFMNASHEQVTDLDNTTFIEEVERELERNYDRLVLRDNYSLLCIPGFLGSKSVIDKWARIAHKNKVMLITDYRNLEGVDEIVKAFEKNKLTGADAHLSNVMLTCNWLVGRGKQKDVGEEEDVYVPPSAALGGMLYRTLMSQVAAGFKFGELYEADAVRFRLQKTEIARLENMGLIPIVREDKTMAFAAKTLFDGDNDGLKVYSVVRVFDYVTKVMMDFLNRRAFQNFDFNAQKDLENEIGKFLNGIAGSGKLIEKFKILRLAQDKNQRDRIYLDIYMKPFFPAKNFVVKLAGHKGVDIDSAEWKDEYEQSK